MKTRIRMCLPWALMVVGCGTRTDIADEGSTGRVSSGPGPTEPSATEPSSTTRTTGSTSGSSGEESGQSRGSSTSAGSDGSSTSPESTTASNGGESLGSAEASGSSGGTTSGAADCEGIPPEALALFERVVAPGVSNTLGACGLGCTPDGFELEPRYWARIAAAAWQRLEPCGAAPPYVTTLGVEEFHGGIDPNTTLVLSTDVFFYNACEEPEVLSADVQAGLAVVEASAPGAPVLFANVPDLLNGGLCPEPQTHNAAIAAAMDEDAGHFVIDLDSAFTALFAGQLSYDGEFPGPSDVVPDGIHLSELGHRMVADVFIARLNALYPGLELPTYGELVIND
ncbi:MAG: SGNH/GDSL hydrolase family protein [Nannocystales bacterium]